ncbi:MAG TPA: 2-C-methyl-D-erythritol 4-phosphate cytidylyltransferase [Caproiciproducens sp.]|nr:2-C-methyl-D-erythritol 4-phosphate cytidylyltransferase [Caproiciproducens sp.]
MKEKPICCAIIVAAGNSSRMALEYSKQFVPLCGIPAIVRTLSAFEAARRIDSVVIVCRGEDTEEIKKLIIQYHYKKIGEIVPGGRTRQQSVLAGIAATLEDAAYFAIHDGARALITAGEIDAAVEDAVRYGASSLAVPVKDTIKVADESGFIVSTPDRSILWAVQTPQVFERGIYLKALARAQEEGADYTDDCQLVEHLGIKVHLCPGEYTNLKLTTPDDIPLAETILYKREGIK